ncbi:AI-2E family transporter [Tropicimonas marinistellae]|uniref:AI-2E family transporter n=1 Tax=Tropicimonas marinistellae TaxID=1739787 RepID=UPI0008309F4D|nr:AI-2E family transporter [Tropicimonas marinistellae]
MTRTSSDTLKWMALLSVTLIVSVLFVGTIKSFLIAMTLAAIAAAMAAPLQARMMIMTRKRAGLAAALTLTIIAIAVIAPLFGVVWLAASQAEGLVAGAEALVEQLEGLSPDDPLPDWVPFRDEIGRYSAQITAKLGEIASAVGGFAVSALTEVTKGTVQFFLDLFVFAYALFFFVQMKRPVIAQILTYSGLPSDTQAELAERMVSISRATLKGTLLIGAAQGALGALGFWATGIEGAAFWGVVMAVLSIIPGLGPLFVIACGIIWLFSQGETVYAIGLAVWGFGVVGTIDNVLRPILVGRDSGLPDILTLISTLGGLTAFGAAGLVLGPVLAGLFLSLWETVRKASQDGFTRESATIDSRAPGDDDTEDPENEPDTYDSVLDADMMSELRELRRLKAEREAQAQSRNTPEV